MNKILTMMVSLCLCASTALFAADGTWNNAAGGAWETAGNWASSIIADGAGNTATFNTDTAAVVADANRTIGNISKSAAADLWLNGGPLTLSGGTPAIDVSAGSTYLNCALAGSAGFDKTGTGNLGLYNTIISGDINVNAGWLWLMWADAIKNADVIVNNGTVLVLWDGVVANGQSITVNNGGYIRPWDGTVGINAPLTLNYPDAGNTFAVESVGANDIINLNGNITLAANTALAITENGGEININAPISGPYSLRLMGRSATTSIGTYNINAACTYTGWTTLQSWGANPRYEIGVNQAFPAGGATTEFSLDAANSSADTSVTLDLNDYSQTVNILWLKPDGAQAGHYVEITGNAGSVLTVNEKFNMGAHANGAHAKITGGKILVPATATHTWLNSPVFISDATMILNAPYYGSAIVDVQSGGIVGGAYYGALTIRDGGKISPGDDDIGSLAAGNVIMQDNSEYDWEINGTDTDSINVTGTLTLPGTANSVLVNVDRTSPISDTYTLISTSAGITGNADVFHSDDEEVSFSIVNNNVIIGVTPEPGMFIGLILAGIAILRKRF